MTDQPHFAHDHPEPAPSDMPAAPPQAMAADATIPQVAGAHDPWARPVDGAATHTDPHLAASPSDGMTVVGHEAVMPVPDSPAPRRRRTAWVLSIAAVIVVLLGVGAYAGVRLWTGAGIAEPETAVPASTSVFARIDLNPGYRDKVAFDGLAGKFPTNGKSTSSLVADLEKSIATNANLNYDTDVKPWFDGRAGIGEWADPAGRPVALLVLASKNDAVAKATLTRIGAKLGNSFGFAVRDGYALIAGTDRDAQADATTAASQAHAHSLADSASFTSTVSHLSGNNLVLVYVDFGKVGPLLADTLQSSLNGLGGGLGGPGDGSGDPTGGLGPLSGLGGLGAIAGGGADTLSHLTGTAAVGASVVDDGVEIRAHEQGISSASKTPTRTDVRPILDGMPDSTIVGAAFDGLDPDSAVLKQMNSALGGLLGRATGGPGGASDQQAQAMVSAVTTLVTSKVLSVAFSGITADKPDMLIAADTGDQSKAASLLATINGLTNGEPIPGVAISQDGTRVQATIGTPPTSGKLGSSALYRETMAGMSNPSVALYVDVQKFAALVGISGVGSSRIAPVKAIGISASSNGTSQDQFVRIIIKK